MVIDNVGNNRCEAPKGRAGASLGLFDDGVTVRVAVDGTVQPDTANNAALKASQCGVQTVAAAPLIILNRQPAFHKIAEKAADNQARFRASQQKMCKMVHNAL